MLTGRFIWLRDVDEESYSKLNSETVCQMAELLMTFACLMRRVEAVIGEAKA